MSIVQISRISHRSGLNQNLPQLSKAELGYSVDTRQLFIGNGTLNDGAPETGNTEILTEYSDILNLANTYSFKNSDAGYNLQTGNARAVYNAVAYGNSTYVAVGTGGHIIYSTDAVTWKNTSSGTVSNLKSITYGNGTFVAAGANGTVIYSSDGVVWQASGAVAFTTVNNVTFGNSLFVLVTLQGSIYTSTTGIIWTLRTSGVSTSLNSIVYGNSKFIAVGAGGVVVSSTDNTATSWSVVSAFTSTELLGINYINSNYVITARNNKTFYSSDGVTWFRTLIDSFTAVTSDGTNTFAITSWGDVYKSTTGTLVYFSSVDSGIENFTNIYNNGAGLFTVLTGSGGIYTSSNGSIWTSRTSGVTTGLNEIYYDGTTYVIVGNNGVILTSTNGTSFTSRTSGTTNNLYSITKLSTTTWIAVGAGGITTTSSNSVTWSAAPSGVTNDLRSVAVADLTGGTYKVLAVGRGGIGITSPDGISWSTGALNGSATSPTGTTVTLGDLNKVIFLAYNSGTYQLTYLVVGDDGVIVIGTYNTNTNVWVGWNTKTSYTNCDFQDVVNNGTYYLTVGDTGLTYANSQDSLAWNTTSQYYSNNLLSPDVYSITTNGTYNLIVGQYGYTYHATSQVQYFKKSTNSLYDTLKSVIYTNQFVASGSSGQIVTSSNGITWTSLSFSYGNNSTIRSLQSKLDDFVSIKDFGAKGDGVTDDTESINRAMYELYCRTNSIPARKTLYFPAGNYIVSGSINVPSHARIVGEGTFNTQITQTANPYIYPYVTWVMYIADNLQQIQNLIGLNGAGLPTDISISNLTINSLNDGIIVNNASRISLEQIRFKGPIASVTSLTDPINSVSTAAVRLLGYNLTVASDINLTHCLFDGFNHGVQVPANQTSSNALIDSCTFQNLFNGIYLNGTTAKGFTFTNSTMDAIYSSGIVAYNAVNFLSMGNYYRDVGNVLQGYTNPQSNVIFFDSATAVGCASVADTFDRLTTASVDRINETINTISWDFQKYLRLGSFVQGNGKTVAVTASTTAVLETSFDEYGSTTGLELLYTVWRNNAVRIGKIKFVLTSGGVYSIDDDYNQTGDVGIIIGYNGTDITYTSDSNGSGTIDYAIRYLEQL